MARLRLVDSKLSKQRDHRRLLVRTLATQLVREGELTSTKPRIKNLAPYIERLVSKSLKNDLASRRYVRARLDTVEATNRLVDLIAPQMKRTSGFVRVKPAANRSGDHAQQATISFVDNISESFTPKEKSKPTTKSTVKPSQKESK